MFRRKPVIMTAVVFSLAAAPLAQTATESVASAAGNGITYTAGTPTPDQVSGNATTQAPWTLSQGDPTEGSTYSSQSPGTVYPTYTPGGATTTVGGVTEPNLAVYPTGSGDVPYASGTVGTPGPVPGYCSTDGPAPETGTVNRQPSGTTLPMSPYYFPFVEHTPGASSSNDLTGYFDYRPKDTDEALVVATSTDNGNTWTYQGEALEQNEGLCPEGDTNDDGEGHAFVMSVNGTNYLYTLSRPAGDNLGVGMLVHQINPSSTDPIAGLPSSEPVGVDPSTYATAQATVPATGGSPISVSSLGTADSPEQITAPGSFEDLAATNPSASVITCTATATSSLTGCTAPGGLTVNSGDDLVQVLGTVSSAITIPQGPNSSVSGSSTGSPGVTVGLSSSSLVVATTNPTISYSFNNAIPGRVYIDGATVSCVSVNGANTSLSSCTTTKSGGLSVNSGDAVTTDPVVPNGVQQTNGLIAPDGIVGTLPASADSAWGAPTGSTLIVYGEKILNYYDVATTTSAVTLPASTIPITPSYTFGDLIPASGSFTIYLGVSAGIQTVTCTGYTSTSFTGCLGGSGSVASGNTVGGPGAAIASFSVLNSIGEGKNKAASLFKNNEDLTLLRVAYTSDGINFTDVGPISGTSDGASDYTDVNNPSAQAYPSSQDLATGSLDTPELRYVGTRGTIITYADGSIGMFDSGSWESDGDSDAFNQIFFTSSSDGGKTWSTPEDVVSTDYTFSASATQDSELAAGHDDPLGISAYYEGRAYSPTVVVNPDGTLTMVFSGYRTPKPIPTDDTLLGTDTATTCGPNGTSSCQYTVGTTDPAIYRNILTVTLTPSSDSPPPVLPESPLALALPLLGAAIVGGAVTMVYRRRRDPAEN